MQSTIRPSHKSVKTYYETLDAVRAQNVSHEMALRQAFQGLLTVTAKKRQWTLVTELSTKTNGGRVVPDGTMRDLYNMPRGYWEAKDTNDDLDAEIRKKIKKGYPTSNIIFEDTQTGVLYQNRSVALRVDLTKPQELCDLLNAYYDYSEPEIYSFEKAIEEFKERVPDLAKGLVEKIEQAHKGNKPFQAAFAEFFELCKASLNPNLSQAAIDEMLVQHLLTIRLFRRIFENADFVRRNVIAAEIEKVIDALTSQSFSRNDFLKSLDRFYIAIEGAARGLTEFSDKQHFLNTVYERFFQGYSVKVADTHGIVYTPQPIVDFMVNSVEEVLKEEFGLNLWSKGVNVLDPCTGTGNFIVNILNRIPKRNLPKFYAEQLFANEVMLLPYYIAALNIEHAYFEQTGEYQPFDGLCFVDTLDMAEHEQSEFGFMTEENTARVERQKQAAITVILGNPPYNVGQVNENDNNKNRKYKVVDRRVTDTYAADSKASNKNALSDAYVKFFRWATDRLEGRDGIVCFVSNNSFIDQVAFDGMQRHLLEDFTCIYHVDLHGNVRRNPKLSGTTHNVFGIQVGVGITLAVRVTSQNIPTLYYHRVPEDWRKEEKLHFLFKHSSVGKISHSDTGEDEPWWEKIFPDGQSNWLVSENTDEFETFPLMGSKETKGAEELNVEAIFKTYSRGLATSRDDVVYDFDRAVLEQRVRQFIEIYNVEVDRFRRAPENTNIDDFVDYDRIKWSRDLKLDLKRGNYAEYGDHKIRRALYRPFLRRSAFVDRILNEEVYGMPTFFPSTSTESENLVIQCTNHSQVAYSCLASSVITEHAVGGRAGQCFPFYVYDEDGSNRRENITDWALGEFRKHYKDKKITKWDIFYYVYGLLHHPGYREKYADCLKRELPRIPYAPDFRPFSKAGKKLANLHVDYEDLEPFELDFIEADDEPLSYHVEKMKLLGPDGKSSRKVDSSDGYAKSDRFALVVNHTLTLDGIPPAVFDYHLGNRSALEWVIDQYRIKTDKRSGITSDPNRQDDPEYIVRLVGQVVRVSVETVALVAGLPEDFGG